MRRTSTLLLGLVLMVSTSAFASEGPPKKNDPNAPPPPVPSSLTGNAKPHCQPGTYPASNFCKPAPPGVYAPPDTTYPVACPAGQTSQSGARGTSECF